MLHCVIFPHTYFVDPLKLRLCTLRNDGDLHDWTRFQLKVIEHIPYLALQHLGKSSYMPSLGFFEDSRDFSAVIEDLCPSLLYIRFAILRDTPYPDFPASEYLLFRFDDRDLESDAPHYQVAINGLDVTSSFMGHFGDLGDEGNAGQDLLYAHQHANMIKRLEGLEATLKRKVIGALTRYVFACTPFRYLDPYGFVMSLSSGIETFLDLKPGEGNREFGRRLAEQFDFSDLQAWGTSFYKLTGKLRHQIISPTLYSMNEVDKLLYKPPNETAPIPAHAHIARLVLDELIGSAISGTKPTKTSLERFLHSNETPLRELAKLCREKKTLGPEYYSHFRQVKQADKGGTLEQMKCIIRHILRELHGLYPDEVAFASDVLDFTDGGALTNGLSDIRQRVDSIQKSIPLGPDTFERKILLRKTHDFIWQFRIPLMTEVHNAISSRDK